MKKTLTLITFCFCSIVAISQPTITTAELPVAGSYWFTGNDTNYTAAILPGGTNVTWDYSNVVSQYLDTTGFISASGTPYATFFSGSNLAAQDPADGSWAYFTSNSTGFYADGIVDATGAPFRLNNSSLIVPVPFTFGNTRTNTTGLQIDTSVNGSNIRVNIDIQTQFEADGYGTVILPGGTYTDVLRVKSVDLTTSVISLEVIAGTGIYAPINTSYSQTSSFRYYQQGATNSFILSVDADSLGQFATSISFQVPTTSTGINVAQTKSTSTYPNPANNAITFTQVPDRVQTITLTSMDGRTCNLELEVMGNTAIMNTSLLSNGLYTFRLGNESGRFMVQH